MTMWSGIMIGFIVGLVTRFWLARALFGKLVAMAVEEEAERLVRKHGDGALEWAIRESDRLRWNLDGRGAVFWFRVARRIELTPVMGPVGS